MTEPTRGLLKPTLTLILALVPASLLAQSAELFLQSLDAPSGTYEQGDSITIQSRTLNIGDAAAGPYSITFYASDDLGVSEDDIPIGSQQRAGLAAASIDETPVIATIPTDLPPGEYFVNGLIDFEDTFPEDNQNFDAMPIVVVDSSGKAIVINTALSDAWFNAATDGQGFFIMVWEDSGLIFLAWFTYDTERPAQDVAAILGEPGHRWLTAQGPWAGNTAMLDVYLTAGGVFDAAMPAPDPAMLVGTMEIVWTDCNAAVLKYDLPALGLSGEIPLERIVLDNVAACEAAQPEEQSG